MKSLITVRDIESIKYSTDEYVILNFYISDLINNQIEIIKITVKIHLVHNLKAKLLIEINIFESEKMNISFFKQLLTVDYDNE